MTETMLDVAKGVMKVALQKGAREVGVGAYRSRQVEVEWRDGKLDKVSEATTRGLGLQLYVDQRYASVATSDLRPEALERFVTDAVSMTRLLAVDPFRTLPDPALYQGQAQLDLQLEDPAYDSVTAQERREVSRELEAAARAVPGSEKILSVTSYFADSQAESFRVHSNGFEGTRRDTVFSMGASVSVKDPDGRRPMEWQGASQRFRADLPAIRELGQAAAQRAMSRVGAQKMVSAVLPMVVENRAGGGLLGRLFGPLSASALQQKRSFLEGKVGVQVGSVKLHVEDDPHVVKGLGSRLFDGEGMAARKMPVLDGGVLRNYYVDTYYGKKLGMAPTTGGSSNLAWKLGTKDRDGLLATVKDGVFVSGFLGGNSNNTTGDFSLGVQGFRVRNGALAEPVSEINISGNHLEFWKRLVEVGNDPYPYSAGRCPTLVFDGVQFAGV
jgi:PmbA protein